MFGFAHGILVANEKSGVYLVTEFEEIVIGIPAEHEADTTLFQSTGDGGNALIEEAELTLVGVRIKRHRREENDAR
jgi:hypothetical protein